MLAPATGPVPDNCGDLRPLIGMTALSLSAADQCVVKAVVWGFGSAGSVTSFGAVSRCSRKRVAAVMASVSDLPWDKAASATMGDSLAHLDRAERDGPEGDEVIGEWLKHHSH